MDPIKILESKSPLRWKYDEEADVLYVAVGNPRKALGADIGDGVIVRYDEQKKEVVGLTILGFKARTLQSITKAN
ncbi:MAG: DUF2283 domain-containing protein [Candidatus Omnitrophica bacterium]|nr:DUF2283 domain-containing protein [Candidatus Omnitrophota bacterium]